MNNWKQFGSLLKNYLNAISFFCSLLTISLILLSSLTVAGEKSTSVTVQTLEKLLFHPLKKAPAQVVTLHNSLLSSEISALVKDVHVQVGDRVLKDQLLVTLECDDYELSKQQLLSEQQALAAEHKFAAYQFERSEKLLKSKSVSQELHRRQASGLSQLEAQLQLLQSKIKLADKTISRCGIKAPYTGVVAERLVNLGENVASHTPLIRLIDVDNLEVEVQAPIVVIDDLNYKTLNFVYREQYYPLEIRAVIPSVETRARHQRVRLRFTDKKALPDAFGMVEITSRELKIPSNYLVSRQSLVGLFVLKKRADGQAYASFYGLKDALIGRDASLKLDPELTPDSKVIIEGRNALNDGDAVSLILQAVE